MSIPKNLRTLQTYFESADGLGISHDVELKINPLKVWKKPLKLVHVQAENLESDAKNMEPLETVEGSLDMIESSKGFDEDLSDSEDEEELVTKKNEESTRQLVNKLYAGTERCQVCCSSDWG